MAMLTTSEIIFLIVAIILVSTMIAAVLCTLARTSVMSQHTGIMMTTSEIIFLIVVAILVSTMLAAVGD
jgi:hypothetical protein